MRCAEAPKRHALGKAAAPETGAEEEGLPGSIGGDVSTLPVRLGRPYGSIEGPAQKRHERLVEMWKASGACTWRGRG